MNTKISHAINQLLPSRLSGFGFFSRMMFFRQPANGKTAQDFDVIHSKFPISTRIRRGFAGRSVPSSRFCPLITGSPTGGEPNGVENSGIQITLSVSAAAPVAQLDRASAF